MLTLIRKKILEIYKNKNIVVIKASNTNETVEITVDISDPIYIKDEFNDDVITHEKAIQRVKGSLRDFQIVAEQLCDRDLEKIETHLSDREGTLQHMILCHLVNYELWLYEIKKDRK